MTIDTKTTTRCARCSANTVCPKTMLIEHLQDQQLKDIQMIKTQFFIIFFLFCCIAGLAVQWLTVRGGV